jgi:hypothetical protein
MLVEMAQPWIIEYPNELWRLFTTGYIHDPDDKRWDIFFCPGVMGVWITFMYCLENAWDLLKWVWNPCEYLTIVKHAAYGAELIRDNSVWSIEHIPEKMLEGWTRIKNLWIDEPFGWTARICGNIIWNCLLVPILMLIGGLSGFILIPISFVVFGLGACFIQWFVGNMVALWLILLSILALFFGTLASAVVTLGALFNRFPKESDHGTCGLYLMTTDTAHLV